MRRRPSQGDLLSCTRLGAAPLPVAFRDFFLNREFWPSLSRQPRHPGRVGFWRWRIFLLIAIGLSLLFLPPSIVFRGARARRQILRKPAGPLRRVVPDDATGT
jgi:hypothetical protein